MDPTITPSGGRINIERPTTSKSGCENGTVEVHRTSPSSPDLRFGPTSFNSGQTTIIFENLPPGTYEVTIVCSGSTEIYTYVGYQVPGLDGPGDGGGAGGGGL